MSNFFTHVTKSQAEQPLNCNLEELPWAFVETVLAAEMDMSIYETCLSLSHISEQDVMKPSSAVTRVLILRRAGDAALPWT